MTPARPRLESTPLSKFDYEKKDNSAFKFEPEFLPELAPLHPEEDSAILEEEGKVGGGAS